MADEIDYKIIERQLAILMTNSVAFSSKLYDMFVSTTPMDIEFNIWTATDSFETITVPNRAKGNIPASYGNGDPNGVIDASYGTMYLNRDDGSMYIKTSLEGNNGWLKIITQNELSNHNRSEFAHEGKLAKMDGAYEGNTPSTFVVADVIDGVPHEEGVHIKVDPSYYAVNQGSLFKLLGGVDNITYKHRPDPENDGLTIVGAINDVAGMVSYDTGCVVRGGKNTLTNSSAFMYIEEAGDDGYKITLNASGNANHVRVMSPRGKMYDITSDIVGYTNQYTSIIPGVSYSIYLDLDEMTIVTSAGKYYKQPIRPYVLKQYDCWLDTNSQPGVLYNIVLDAVYTTGEDTPDVSSINVGDNVQDGGLLLKCIPYDESYLPRISQMCYGRGSTFNIPIYDSEGIVLETKSFRVTNEGFGLTEQEKNWVYLGSLENYEGAEW